MMAPRMRFSWLDLGLVFPSGGTYLEGRRARPCGDEVVDDAGVAAVLLPIGAVDGGQVGVGGLGEGDFGGPSAGHDLAPAGGGRATEPCGCSSVGGTDEQPVAIAD